MNHMQLALEELVNEVNALHEQGDDQKTMEFLTGLIPVLANTIESMLFLQHSAQQLLHAIKSHYAAMEVQPQKERVH